MFISIQCHTRIALAHFILSRMRAQHTIYLAYASYFSVLAFNIFLQVIHFIIIHQSTRVTHSGNLNANFRLKWQIFAQLLWYLHYWCHSSLNILYLLENIEQVSWRTHDVISDIKSKKNNVEYKTITILFPSSIEILNSISLLFGFYY